jgi:hypothetical protein
LEIPLLSNDLTLSNPKPACRVSALHFSSEINIANGFLTLSSFREVFLFSALPDLTPALTTVSLLESIFGFKIVTRLVDTQKRPSPHLQSMLPSSSLKKGLFQRFNPE